MPTRREQIEGLVADAIDRAGERGHSTDEFDDEVRADIVASFITWDDRSTKHQIDPLNERLAATTGRALALERLLDAALSDLQGHDTPDLDDLLAAHPWMVPFQAAILAGQSTAHLPTWS